MADVMGTRVPIPPPNRPLRQIGKPITFDEAKCMALNATKQRNRPSLRKSLIAAGIAPVRAPLPPPNQSVLLG